MLGIVQGPVRAVGLIPQTGIAVRMEQLHFLAGLLQRLRMTAVGPAGQEPSPGRGALPLPQGPQYVLECPAHQRMSVDHRGTCIPSPNPFQQP